MNKRYYWLAVLIMVISALFLPFYVTVSIFVISVFAFDNFYIGLFIFFIMDAVYGFHTFRIGQFYGMLSIFSILAYVVLLIVKDITFFSKR